MTRLLAGILALTLMPILLAQDSEVGFVRLTPADLEWTPQQNGSSFVVIHGDPQAEGLYILRYTFPPGVFSPPHHHDQDRFVTVISGVWHTGIGASGDRDDTVPLSAGSYMKHPAGGVHYDGAIDVEAIVEIRGMGPVSTIMVEE